LSEKKKQRVKCGEGQGRAGVTATGRLEKEYSGRWGSRTVQGVPENHFQRRGPAERCSGGRSAGPEAEKRGLRSRVKGGDRRREFGLGDSGGHKELDYDGGGQGWVGKGGRISELTELLVGFVVESETHLGGTQLVTKDRPYGREEWRVSQRGNAESRGGQTGKYPWRTEKGFERWRNQLLRRGAFRTTHHVLSPRFKKNPFTNKRRVDSHSIIRDSGEAKPRARSAKGKGASVNRLNAEKD